MNCLLLAAGFGTRLGKLTEQWPKCLMPIHQVPLLEYWLNRFADRNFNKVYVNTHYLRPIVKEFISRPEFESWVIELHEAKLLGTAATIRENYQLFKNKPLVLVHADNWSQFDLTSFINFHNKARPKHCAITMMTFDTDNPQSCGIVELDKNVVVLDFHEKVSQPPGNKANAAVYILEPEVLEEIANNKEIVDFSTQVLPSYISRIATWHNGLIHRDIGTPEVLALAQKDPLPEPFQMPSDNWFEKFLHHPIQQQVAELTSNQLTTD